jgi:nucleotide-binding universal stress UspA family protein
MDCDCSIGFRAGRHPKRVIGCVSARFTVSTVSSGKVLCAVAQDDAAGAVLDTAQWVANRLGCSLVLAHVAGEAGADAEALLTSMRVRLGLGAQADVRLLQGSPAEALMAAAEAGDAELLVVGSRGRGSIRSALLGSVSRTLAMSSPRPVLIVPAGTEEAGRHGGDGSLVCGVDGSPHAVAAARLAGELGRRMGLRVLVVHALPDLKSVASYPGARGTAPPVSAQPDARARLAQEIVDVAVSAVGGGATGMAESGAPWEVLESVADREDGQMIVVAARGHTGLRTALLGSVAARLAASSRPVVVLPEPAEARVAAPQSV